MAEGIVIANQDREAFIDKIRLYLSKDNIIFIKADGKVDNKKALLLRDAIFHFFDITDGTVDVVVDMNKGGQASSDARKIFKELIEHEKVRKLAFHGLHPVAQVVASFVMGVSNKKDMRFFKTSDEALNWIKE